MSKNTVIDGIAASEHLDSSGESLSVKGMDISSLGGPDSILNWEHGAKEKPSQVVGKVTFARKIFSRSDAKTRREIYFWNKVKKPFVYIKAELFDGLGHSGAQDVAAMLKYKNKDKGKDSRLVVGFSIEGGKMDKKGMVVTKSVARDVAITVKPCNKVCDAEILENTKDDKDFLYKNQKYDCEILEKGDIYVNLNSYEQFSKTEGKFRTMILADIKKTEKKQSIKIKPKREYFSDDESVKDTRVGDKIKYNKRPKTGKDIYNDPNTWKTQNNMRKALIAGVMSGAPSGLTGMAAMATEDLLGSKKKDRKIRKIKKIKKIKKNQPSMGFKNLGIENNPNMQVKTVDPSKSFKTKAGRDVSSGELEGMKVGNKYLQGAKQSTGVSDLNELPDENREYVEDAKEAYSKPVAKDSVLGVNIASPEVGVNEAMDFSGPGQSKDKMADTKGRGNFPSVKQHEGLHRTFSGIAERHSPEHSKNLISHIMDNFFSPENVGSVSDFVNTLGYDSNNPHLKEEHLTHILDLITNPEKRNHHESLVQDGKVRDVDYKQLKRGWQAATKFTKKLDESNLNKINDFYNSQNKAKKNKKVSVQRYDSKGNQITE